MPTLDELRDMETQLFTDLAAIRMQTAEKLDRLDYVQAEIRKRGGYDTQASLNRTVTIES
jgi:hypothetical protein